MSSAGSVRAGKAFVEITANDSDFQRALKRVQHSTVRLGNMMRQMGSGMAIAGGVMGLPMIMAARSAATFEDALLELKGAAGDLSPDQMRAVREEALRLSREMGVAPEKIGQAFALLIKAGMTVENAMAGGAKAAVEFSRVSGVDATQAAEFMSDAMNVFDISASQAADTLSAAADSSSTSIAAMVESFALVASVAKGTGQSLFGLAQGFAALAQYGIKGEEAGTGIKTLLVKLLSPAEDARKALATLGISMGDLVDQTGKLLPLAQLSAVFRKSMAGMDKSAKQAMLTNDALVKVFDVRGIRVIQAFADIGEDGFAKIAEAMENSRTVADKFSITMSGITGSTERLTTAVKLLAIAFMEGATPALRAFTAVAAPVMHFLSFMLTAIPVISPILATLAAALFGVGVALMSVGGLMAFMNFSLKGIINFSLTWTRITRVLTSVIGGLSSALGVLRLAMLAIPGWGWLLAGLAAAGGIAAWMMSGPAEPPANKSGIKRDQERVPLGAAGAGMAAGAGNARGEGAGTFSGAVARQLSIGPALSSAEETAANTGRIADGIDKLVEQGGIPNAGRLAAGFAGAGPAVASGIPNAGRLAAGFAGAGPAVASGIVAASGRDLLSATERAALASEQSRDLLRRLVEKSTNGGLAFA